jgi:RNA polymerase sigma factor (TIGR02999 family)
LPFALCPATIAPADPGIRMSPTPRDEVTRLLEAESGHGAFDAAAIAPLVYNELRAIAQRYLRDERAGHTLQPTALVNEAFLKLVDQTRVGYRGRTHFLAVAALMMRRVLVDHARQRGRIRRGRGMKRAAIHSELVPSELDFEALLELDDALKKLAELDARQAKVVELRFFGGLTVEEAADQIGVSKRTIEDDWTHAKAWLRLQFAPDEKA